MEPAQALADLKEISSQIEAAALFDEDGTVIASTLADEAAGRRFVDAARALLRAAEEVPRDATAGPLVQLEASTLDGSVFVVRDAPRAVAATTRAEPTVGLVFYDLKSCLRSAAAAADDDGKPRPSAGSTIETNEPGEGGTAA
jgi:predicted regulator of Ras-like GTPase activity (Roadblock/LC7/MglB family)